MKHTRTYYDLKHSTKRITSNRGGTRSGKTYGTLEWLIEMAGKNRNRQKSIVTVARKTMPALRGSAMRDFFDILNATPGLYSEQFHDKTNNE
jgi:hypothetical protein